MNKPMRIAAVVALVTVVLVIANQWRVRSERSAAELAATALPNVDEERSSARVPTSGTQDIQAPTELPAATPLTNDAAADGPSESVPAEQEFEGLVTGIDPSLRERNLIQLARSAATGPGFVDVERRFSTEGTDPNWSDGMEARILDQVSQIPGLRLASIDAECRETICRVKLFYPPNTNALSSLEQLQPIAKQIGFGHVVEVATLGDDGVPISLLYLQRDDA